MSHCPNCLITIASTAKSCMGCGAIFSGASWRPVDANEVPPPEPNIATRAAKFLSLTYVPVSVLHMLLGFVSTGDLFVLKIITAHASFWLTLLGSVYVGLRITKFDTVAWWVGITGALILFYFRIGYLVTAWREGFTFLPMGVTLLWLIAFTACLVCIKFDKKMQPVG